MTDELRKIADKVLSAEGSVGTTIQGDAYVIKLLPAMQGVSLCNRLFRTFVPAIGAWLDGDKREGLILPEDDTMFSEITHILAKNFETLGIEDVIRAICSGLTCNGVEVDFDNHFRGKYDTLLLVLEVALKENFGSFFTGYLEEKGINLQVIVNSFKTPTEPLQSPEG